jgi:hypothetical protein
MMDDGFAANGVSSKEGCAFLVQPRGAAAAGASLIPAAALLRLSGRPTDVSEPAIDRTIIHCP